MRGQLTEQLPEDGAAASFIARSTSKKTTKMMEVPFEIPSNWIWTSIEEIAVPVGKKADQIFANEVKKSGKYPAISQGERFIDGYTDEEKAIVNLPLVIFGDHTKIVKFVDFPFVICADGVKCLKVSFPNNPKYIFYWMKHASSAIEDRGYARHYSLLKKYPVPLPPLAEQQRIVEKIGQVFSVLDTIDALQARHADNLAALKAKLIDAAIRGKLTEQLPQDGTAEELYQHIQAEKQALIKAGKIRKEKPLPEVTPKEAPFDIPANWKWVRLANIWSVINGDRGKNYPAKSTLSRNGIPFVSALNLDGGTVANDDRLLCLSESQYDKLGNGKLIQGDIVVCIRGSLGKHGRYPFEKGAIASSLAIMRLPINEPLLDDYLMTYLDAPLFFDEILKYNNGTAQPNLAAKNLEKFLIPLPPLAEQQRIVARLDEVLKIIEQ